MLRRICLAAVLGLAGITAIAAEEPDTRESSRDGLSYARIPAGSFRMGCVPDDDDCEPDERPRRRVELAAFWLGTTEVTVEAYQRFAEATDREMPEAPEFNPRWRKGDQPMVEVTWDDAAAFCEWSGGRLPTEAEWERAARGGRDGEIYPWGTEDPECDHDSERAANSRRCGDAPEQVPFGAANAFGLHDTSGNVWEWCADWYDDAYYDGGPDRDPAGPDSGTRHVLRGGSWYVGIMGLRTSNRHADEGGASVARGFRCARDEPPSRRDR